MPDSIYTRRGDDGTTQLLYSGPQRIGKDDPRPNAYGDADEAVAALGVARAEASVAGETELADSLLALQRQLFVLNAELATAPENWDRLKAGESLVTQEMVDGLEAQIDSYEKSFEQPADFIVPGNTRLGAALDLARTVIRRAERSTVALSKASDVRPEAMRFLNRLADLVWMMERYTERTKDQPRTRPDKK